MSRKISNGRLFQSLDDWAIAKEERKARRCALAKPKKAQKSAPPERWRAASRKSQFVASTIDSLPDAELERLERMPSFEPRHQIFRRRGVIVRKGESIHESHGPRGREKKLLCDRRQSIRRGV